MSTSIHNGIVTFADSLYGTDDDPMDVTLMRDGVANGLLHAADSMAQVRVNYMLPRDAIFGEDAWEQIDAGFTSNVFYQMGGSPFGPWPLTVHADGTPYVLRVRVGAAASSTTASTITIRVVIAPIGDGQSELVRSVDHVYTASFSAATVGTTPTWLTGTSGASAFATYMTVSPEDARAWMRRVQVYDAVNSGTPRSVEQCLVAAHVYASSSNAGVTPRLHAVHIAEYCGL